MKRVIITGPTGSIGTALIEHLIQNDVEVLAVVRRNSKRKSNIVKHPLVKCIELNLDELESISQFTEGNMYDVFFHFGWDGTFGNSRNNMQGQLLNIQYTLDAVEAASRAGCKKFIGAGSQAEYGRVEGNLSATTPVFPENGYGIAKLCAGQMSRILCEQKGIEHIWTRILSVYGPNDGLSTMVMSTIAKLLKGQRASLTQGEQKWDYLYSKDAGKAMYLLGEKGQSGKVYCIGSGQIKRLKDYIEVIKENIDSNAELGYGEIPYSEKQVMYLCADISELEQDTGFMPDYCFEEGIKETIDWYKDNVL